MGQPTSDGPIEIALVGDLTDNEGELTDKFLWQCLPVATARCDQFPGGSPSAPCRSCR